MIAATATLPPRPFTVIGGFLGAGKTTLLNRLIAGTQGLRLAVLVNDFGTINVDARLVADHDGQTMTLTNGCICCSMADGFIQAMLRLMETPERFDHVIVEASGVALPSKIMDFARLDPLLLPDAVIGLVDAASLGERLRDAHVGSVVADQIRQADILVLNRTDLVDATAPAQAELARLNPTAPVLTAQHADVPLAVVLGTMSAKPARDTRPGHGSFHTRTFTTRSAMARVAFEVWSKTLPSSTLRGKGIVLLSGEGPALWQKVGAQETMTPWAGQAERSEIVVIGTRPLDAVPGGPFDA